MRKNRSNWNLRHGLVALLSAGVLALPACAADEQQDLEFFNPSEDGAAEAVGETSQAMLRTSLCSDPSTATITGTAGNDYILGTSGDDIIFALGGDDIVLGKGGNDIICGGDGVDSLQGGDGNDHIEGGAGYNFIRGDNGDDVLAGGDDGNEIQGNAGNDDVHGGAGADTLYGGDGDDRIDAGAGNDYVAAGVGNDCMDGGAGNDNLNGEAGDDSLKGGDDPDFINCGAGNDIHESDASDGVNNCETADAVNCFGFCPCNTANSFFEAFVTGNIPFTPGGNGFCNNSSSTSLAVVFPPGAIAAGGEAIQSGSGFWACESAGGFPGDTGFLPNIPEEQARYCGDLVRDAMIAQGINPNTQCGPW